MRTGEEHAVCGLIETCFSEFVAPDYNQEGVTEFFRYANPASMKERSRKDYLVLVALDSAEIVGAIEVRACSHISLLFVKKEYHRQGVARRLLRLALESCKKNTRLRFVDVQSSLYAVGIYEKLGFVRTGPERESHGIRFVPMKLAVR